MWAWAPPVTVVVLGLAVWTWVSARAGRATQMPPLVLSCVAFLIVWLAIRLVRTTRMPKVAAAEALALRERFDEAVPELRRLIPRTAGWARYRALVALGSCASLKGDFVEAAQVYAMAARSTSGALAKMLAPSAHAYAAFALAAAGRLDEAERALVWSAWGTGMPASRAAVTRARALVLSKRKAHAELRELLLAERECIRSSLPRRDRALLRALAAAASPEPARIAVEPEIAGWLARVVPEHRATWEGA
jgi:hypothetical protein